MRSYRDAERGSALVYILIAIALLAALTVSFMGPSGQQTQSQSTLKTVSEISSQVEFIRSAIQECVLVHPQGDSGARTAGAQKNAPYPLMPDDSYLDNCVADPAAADDYVSHLRCPGKPKNDPCHADVFGASSGKFLPPPPPLFGNWHYYAGDDGVFLWIETDKTDSFLQTAFEKLDEDYAECEADIVDATSGAIDLDSGTTISCANGSRCFRVWMISKAPQAVYQAGDSDGDETAEGCGV
ncbi:MAG: hypothetical protein KDJ15_02325 [Alphaproteobacteria bacterium]|nr:hypothetical protein [Alphaproteobacteria bacterium]